MKTVWSALMMALMVAACGGSETASFTASPASDAGAVPGADPAAESGESGAAVAPVPDKGVAVAPDAEQVAVTPAPLTGHRWLLTRLGGESVISEETPVTALFADGRVTGSGGCNGYFATVDSPGDGRLKVGPAGATRRACATAVMDFEMRYLAALSQVDAWEREEERLLLSGAAEDLLFTATPLEP